LSPSNLSRTEGSCGFARFHETTTGSSAPAFEPDLLEIFAFEKRLALKATGTHWNQPKSTNKKRVKEYAVS
jgi:hypothetical protein